MNDDQRHAASEPGRRDAARAWRRPAWLAVLVAAAALGLAACGGGSSSPQVASLPTGSHGGGASSAASGSAAAAGATGNVTTGSVTQLLNEWTACMRRLGDTSQATPTVDASKVIHLIEPTAGFADKMGLGGKSGTNSCTPYMRAAQKALGGDKQATGSTASHLAQELKFAKCMRAHGIADFADPNSNGQLNHPPDSGTAQFAAAQKTCLAQNGITGNPGREPGSIDPTLGASNG